MAWEGSQGATTVVDSGGTGGDVPDTDQSRKRSYAIYTDQHGRVWGANIENKTGDPCGPLEPGPAWRAKAPIIPLDKFITVNSRQRQLFIRYEDIIYDIAEANQLWETELRKFAVKMYGTAAPTAIANPPAELLDIVGPRPGGDREVWEAAIMENQWILGLTDKKPKWAEKFFPEKEVVLTRANKIVIENKYPDADEEVEAEAEEAFVMTYPTWTGPTKGWKLSDGSYVERLEGEDKDSYKARADAAEAELEA